MSKHYLTLFHGTSSVFVSAIRKQGLRPDHHGLGADKWALKHSDSDAFLHPGHEDDIKEMERRPASVFITSRVEYALQFAGYTADETGGKPEVVVVRVPEDQFKQPRFDTDEFSQSDPDSHVPIAFKTSKPIPASWIADVIDVSKLLKEVG